MAKRRKSTKRAAAARKGWRTRKAAARFKSEIAAASRHNPRKKRSGGSKSAARRRAARRRRDSLGRFKNPRRRTSRRRKARKNPFDRIGFWHRKTNGRYAHPPSMGGEHATKRSRFARKVAKGRRRSSVTGRFKNPRQLPAPRRTQRRRY